MRTLLVAAAVLASWVAAPARGDAQVAQGAAAPSAGAEAAADVLIEQAARAYDQNRLDEALGLLARAYELSARPSILYNRAQVLRAKDDCAAALDAYSRFVAETTQDDPNRDRATRRRDEMQACVDRHKAEATSSAPGPAAEAAVPPVPTPPPAVPLAVSERAPAEKAAVVIVASSTPEEPARHRQHAMRVAGWTLVGAGVIAAGVAAALAWQAHQNQNQVNQTIESHSTWNEGQQAVVNDGQRDAAWARWLGAAAAVAGGGGVALLIVSRPPPAAPGMAGDPASHATTALLGWSGTF